MHVQSLQSVLPQGRIAFSAPLLQHKSCPSGADTKAMGNATFGSPGTRFRAKYEKLLRKSPRTLEIACALVLIVLALEFLSEVVFAEWFYHTYKRDYAYTLEWRIAEWVYGFGISLMALWMLALAWTLLRGAPKRWDKGLFSPAALRVWGLIFAALPLLILAVAPHAIAHFHLLFWCVLTSGACFALAHRRSKAVMAQSPNPEHQPIE